MTTEDGWLKQALQDAHESVIYKLTPTSWRQIPMLGEPPVPLPADDAKSLRAKMVEHYRLWTGRNLAIDLLERKPVPAFVSDDDQ